MSSNPESREPSPTDQAANLAMASAVADFVDIDPAHLSHQRLLGMVVRQLTLEVLSLTGQDPEAGSASRRLMSHVRQIAMYVCHVAYSMPQAEIALVFGRDRSTVRHACHIVEDRRDDPAFDTLVSIIERMACTVHLVAGARR
ncbi:chromosomal replication initiator DnaA [Peteryoungia desertarenae]|uniref:Chromosomal replication initiator DnaA n=1 Tax=Peteryoungia desertarenae TaxID=1813451 RepID=A0ABX6QMQ4_9HYPH|nr:helix-turn-helix domain-containing protein [Peteryoungia desertarenae]QLF69813.1 chromosomal replication initiator DnaA [Peteryoungia desertarenae]